MTRGTVRGHIDHLRRSTGIEGKPDTPLRKAYGSYSSLIMYAETLENLVDTVDEAATRNTLGELSAADVMEVLFYNGLGSARLAGDA